ncbi:MAG: tRNA (adenosine(37)-N6)-threonylcarbamoyltransferase complex transferase subunit TsaD [Actinobacteria bacterium]|nr:tRNA (adenosine(37)-N6)-threonylcarbamoyltransferase complex transferase subunit TsaD [Actinomycetota bacterium]
MSNSPVSILGIETSCDETSAAVVADGCHVLSSVVAGQDELHSKFGGVVPEIASRAHIERINPVIAQALDRAGVNPSDLAAIAVSNRPGLIGSLLIGVTAAKTLAWAWDKPLIDIDHVQAHIYAACLDADFPLPFPAVALVVSGGHTSLYFCQGPLDVIELGSTADDAAGEAFDKVAAILKLGYPGGPLIDKLSSRGNPQAVNFPRSWLSKESLGFSFSGIKTSVLYHVRGQNAQAKNVHLDAATKADIAASFQQAVVDVLVGKTMLALKQRSTDRVILGGGVCANTSLRAAIQRACEQAGTQLFLAPVRYCTDNAAMVAGLAYHKLQANQIADLSLTAHT